MQMRTGVGWQYAIADLSLILFLIAASGLTHGKPAAAKALPAPPPTAPPPPLVADPVAVWRPGAGMPTLGEWLSSQPRDSRQRLTIIARYAGGDASAASARAASLLGTAGPASGPVRIVIEPAPSDDLSAALTWDAGT